MNGGRERSDNYRGWCATCRHRRAVRTTRGSEFTLCERSFAEPARFAKYPRLPVVRCNGFEAALGPREGEKV
jgi:hypothetical protein